MNEYAIRAASAYKMALTEVLQGKNLDKHYKDAEHSIVIVENKIAELVKQKLNATSLLELKQKLVFLKTQIQQRWQVHNN